MVIYVIKETKTTNENFLNVITGSFELLCTKKEKDG